MDKSQQVKLPTCAECRQPFSWDNAYHHDDTPGSASYNPPGHGVFRPRAYCPNCGALVAEWHIDKVEDYDEWAWYGANVTLNASRPLPPSALYAWGKGIPLQFIPKFEEHRLVLDASGNPIARSEGLGRVVDSPVAGVTAPTPGQAVTSTPVPAVEAPQTEQTSTMETCKRCGRSIQTSDFMCPYCGHIQWGVVVTSMILILLCLGAAILSGPHIATPWLRSIVVWGGGIVGSIILLSVIIALIDGLQKRKKLLPESAVEDMSPSTSRTPQAVAPPKAPSTVHVTVKISGAIHGSAEHRGTYEMTLPLDMRGPHLLNTIASRIIRPDGPARYYTGYQLYGTWGTSALTCDALSTQTLRMLGAKDGDVVEFIDFGGSFM